MKRVLLSLLAVAIVAVFETSPASAQKKVVISDFTKLPTNKLHLVSTSKIINTKNDVSIISRTGGWYFVRIGSKLDIYDSEFNLCFANQDPQYWHQCGTEGYHVDNDISIVGDGQFYHMREKRILGQIGPCLSYSNIVDGVCWVKREVIKNENRYYTYEFCTTTGETLLGEPMIDSRYSYDLENPSPLKDGRRAVYVQEMQKWAFVDESGTPIIQPTYVAAHNFHEGLAAVRKEVDGEYKWGFINPNGEEVIPFKFTKEPGDFYDGVAVVTKLNGKQTYLKKDGTTVNTEVDVLLPRWKGRVVLGINKPTYTRFLTPTKDIVYENVALWRYGWDLDCSVPFIAGGFYNPVITFDGELLWYKSPGIYLQDGIWWNNTTSGYSAVIFNMKGEILMAFKTIKEEF